MTTARMLSTLTILLFHHHPFVLLLLVEYSYISPLASQHRSAIADVVMLGVANQDRTIVEHHVSKRLVVFGGSN